MRHRPHARSLACRQVERGAPPSWRAARTCNDDDAGPGDDTAVEHGKVHGRADQAKEHGHRHEAPEPAQLALDDARDLRPALPCARARLRSGQPRAAGCRQAPSAQLSSTPRPRFLCMLVGVCCRLEPSRDKVGCAVRPRREAERSACMRSGAIRQALGRRRRCARGRAVGPAYRPGRAGARGATAPWRPGPARVRRSRRPT